MSLDATKIMAFTFGKPGTPVAPIGGQSSSSFSFGGQQQQQQQQQPSQQQVGGFGSGGSGGLFGQQQQQQPVGAGTSLLFGAPSTQPQGQQQQQQQGSLFGAPQNNTNSLFGTQQSQPQQQQLVQSTNGNGGGLFGAAKPFGQTLGQPAQANPLTLSQLGGPASYQQQQQQQNKLGQTGADTFGASSSAIGGAGTSGSVQDPNVTKRLGPILNDRLEYIRASWDMKNIQTCQFLYYFYNAIPLQPSTNVGELAMQNPNFGRRQDAIGPRHDGLWLQVLRENPDRSKLVPVLAVGFPDLKARVGAQQAEAARQSDKLAELQKRLDDLTSKHSLSNSVRISAICRRQTSLHHRLVGLAKRSHLLIPALRGHSITAKEEQLRSVLHACELELETISSMTGGNAIIAAGVNGHHESQRAGGGGASSGGGGVNYRLRGRINELWALLGTLKAKREASALSNDGSAPLEWAVVDQSAVEDVVKILASQQQGLDHLSATLQSDSRALHTIVQGLEGVELVGTR